MAMAKKSSASAPKSEAKSEAKSEPEPEPVPPEGVPSPLHARAGGWTVKDNRWVQKGA